MQNAGMHWLRALAGFALAAAMSAPARSACVGEDILASVDFESDIADPRLVLWADEGGTAAISTDVAYRGARSLHLTSGDDRRFLGVAHARLTVPVASRSGDVVLEAVVMTRGADAVNGGADVYARTLGADGAVLFGKRWADVVRGVIASEGRWSRISLSLALTPDTRSVDLTVRGGGTLEAIHVDEMCVRYEREPRARAPDDVRAYVDEALAAIEAESLHRDRVDWTALRADVEAHTRGARTTRETWPAIELALRALKDGHSMFIPPQSVTASNRAPVRMPVDRSRGVLVVRVPPYLGTDIRRASNFAKRGFGRVRARARGACGAVVDLRANGGGNMWPMLGALSPLLTAGVVGYFEDVVGRRTPWTLDDGVITVGALPMMNAARADQRLGLPVAILYGTNTLSSGEAVALAFREQPWTRSFGTSTGGASTSNRLIELPDGARIALTTQWMADRRGGRAAGALQPDVRIDDPDAVLDAALEWLEREHGCRG